MVVIAQLAEHRIVVPSVVGSSPTLHPKSSLLLGGIKIGAAFATPIFL